MTDFTYGVGRPNWLSNTGGASVTSAFEFITISTNVDIRSYAQNIALGASTTVATATQGNLNKLLEIVSLRGQPVVMGNVGYTSGYCSLFVATEHAGGWFNVGSPNTLLQRIVADGVNFGFGVNLSSVTCTNSATVTNSTVIPVTGITSGVSLFAGMTFTGTGVTNGVIQEVLPTSIIATLPYTISNGTTLTFVPPSGAGANDTPSTGTNGGLAVTFSSILT